MKKLYLVFLIFIYATGVGLASIRPIEDPKKPKPSSEEPLKVNLNGEGSLSEQVSAAANKYLNQRLNGSLTGYKQTQKKILVIRFPNF